MNLTLTRRGDYVIRAALCLAGAWREGSVRRIRDVAREMAVPISYTPQVLGFLTRAGLAEARPGPGGGYRLARPPAAISMLEVTEAAEGPLTPTRCILRGGPCRWESACSVHPSWAVAAEAFRSSLRSMTLADVAAEDARLRAAAGSTGSRAQGIGPGVGRSALAERADRP
jgi:Rrf2 family protein